MRVGRSVPPSELLMTHQFARSRVNCLSVLWCLTNQVFHSFSPHAIESAACLRDRLPVGSQPSVKSCRSLRGDKDKKPLGLSGSCLFERVLGSPALRACQWMALDELCHTKTTLNRRIGQTVKLKTWSCRESQQKAASVGEVKTHQNALTRKWTFCPIKNIGLQLEPEGSCSCWMAKGD